jgi:hypothetical protein
MTNEEQMQVLKEAIKSNYKGSLAEILQPQQQPQGPEGVAMQQQMPEMPVPPASPPQINPASARPPVQDNQGHLVQSYQSAPPGLRNLPSGPAEGMLIQKMEKGGTKDPNPKQPTGYDDKPVISERTFDAFKNLDVVKDSYEFIPNIKPHEMQNYVEFDGKLVFKSDLEEIQNETYQQYSDKAAKLEYVKPLSEEEFEQLQAKRLSYLFDQRRLDQENFVGSDILNNYEDFKDIPEYSDYTWKSGREMTNAPVYKAMDKVLPALDKLTDAEVQEFTRLINTLSSPYTEAMSENEDFGQGDAFKILMGQDLSGIKKYRKKMGLTKGDILDLVQPGKNAGVATKALASSAKAVIRLKTFQDGGPRRTDGPRAIPSNEGMTGMMKAKIAMENEFGNNPAISRMIKPTDKSYDFGDGRTGTHHMGSYGKSAIPNIQDVGGSLQYTGPRTDEAIKFDREQDARYFAEKYKDVAPALRKRKSGGYKPKYPQKFQEGGNDQVTPYDMDYVTYGSKEYNKAYKEGRVASTTYDEKGEPTLNMQMLPEVEIVTERGSGPSTLESAAYAQEVNPVIRGVQQSGREKVALATLGLPTAGIIGAELGLGYAGQQLVRSGSQSAYTNILKPTAQKLIAPIKRYGTKAATDFTNIMSKSPAGQTLMQTAKSKTGSLLSGTYNTMKGMAVPQAYGIIANQAQSEIKGEGTVDNRLQAFKKATDVVPQLAKIKDTFKIGKDLYDKDYDSAALRTVSLLGDKNPLVKYGTKLLNKFTDTDLVESTPEAAKNVGGKVIEGVSTIKQALTPEGKLIAGNRYGGYRKKLRKKKRK